MDFWTLTLSSRRQHLLRPLVAGKFDGKGNFTNTLTLNDNGTVTHASDSGSYTVNDDCTGAISIMGGAGTVEIVIVNGGNRFFEICTNPFSIVSTFSVAKKQFPDDER